MHQPIVESGGLESLAIDGEDVGYERGLPMADDSRLSALAPSCLPRINRELRRKRRLLMGATLGKAACCS